MVIDKIFVTNTTQLSLSDRFTILQSVRHTLPPVRQWPEPYAFQNNDPPHTRNKKTVNRIGGTPVVQAALALKKIPLKQRIGKIGKLVPQRMPNARSLQSNHRYDMGSVLSPGRLGLSNGAREGLQRANSYSNLRMPRIRQRSRSRANSVGNLSRSNSWGNLSDADWPQYNGNAQRGRKNRGKGNFRYGGRSRGNWGRGGGGGGNNGGGRGAQGWGRGRGRGRGRGWYRSSNNQQPPPSREELDLELEEYMAASRGFLDKELDSYMNTAMDTQ